MFDSGQLDNWVSDVLKNVATIPLYSKASVLVKRPSSNLCKFPFSTLWGWR
jgi:hypothetical protein